MKQDSVLPFEKTEREILLKKQAQTSDKYGKDPEKRTVKEIIEYGIININKPSGPTSHQVSAYVKEILKINKAGHSGTLDPKVTGVLPVAVGRATRVVEFLLKAGKEYVCIMHLHKKVEEAKLKEVCKQFIGKIAQLPPIKSAIKRQLRHRKIYYLNIIEIDERDVLFRVGCQAGTYIRKLVHDIGYKLGCGAHMSELVRTKVAFFNDNNWVSLHELSDALFFYESTGKEDLIRECILPIERAVEHIPKIWVFDTTVDTICHGANLKIPGISKLENEIQEGDIVAIMTLKNELVGLGNAAETSSGIMKKEKGIAVKIDKVFMNPGTYPTIERR